MNSSSTGTRRSIYQISVAASDTEQAKAVVARIFCPDPDHAAPCPVPWESSTDGSTVIEQFHIEQGLPES